MRQYFFYTLFLTLLLVPLALHAQTFGGIENITLKLRPDRPRANETVVVELETYAIDLNSSSIVWTLNGATAKSGVGVRSFTFTTGALGSTSNITAFITTIDGLSFTQSISVRPAEVDLIFEAEVYTPPFYKGRSTFTHESFARVIAEPYLYEGNTKLHPSTLIYTWKENGKVYAESSGSGKNVFYTQSKLPFRAISIEVEVSSPDKKQVARRTLSLSAGKPSVLFYENHPVYGIMYNKALRDRVSLSGEELGIAAVPYNFSIANRHIPALEYKWSINNIGIDHDEPNIVLRRPSETGLSLLSLQISNIAALFQFSNELITIDFEKPSSGFSNI